MLNMGSWFENKDNFHTAICAPHKSQMHERGMMINMELQIKNVSKKYGNFQALQNFNFTFQEGVYGLLGPNGAGKSTLMNIITNNLLPSEGEIIVNGNSIKQLGENYLKKIGYVPQHQSIYPTFTGNRFLYYMATLKGLSRVQAEREVPEVLELLNLTEYANKRLGGYSGGMKQRILIAQGLLGAPEILILDEPTAGLDPKERIRIRNIISKVAINKTVIYATHVVQDIETIARELLLLKKGKLIDSGLPEALLEKVKPYVFEVVVEIDQVENLETEYRIGNITKAENGKLCVRLLGEKPPISLEYSCPRPTLEDVYLYEFGDESVNMLSV